MDNKVKKEEITHFLKEFKRYAQKQCTFIPRQKNVLTMSYLGITVKEAKQIILQLTYVQYCDGPQDDRDNPGHNVWEFGVCITNHELYIKLSDDFTGDVAKCLSFHIAKQDLLYPLREGG